MTKNVIERYCYVPIAVVVKVRKCNGCIYSRYRCTLCQRGLRCKHRTNKYAWICHIARRESVNVRKGFLVKKSPAGLEFSGPVGGNYYYYFFLMHAHLLFLHYFIHTCAHSNTPPRLIVWLQSLRIVILHIISAHHCLLYFRCHFFFFLTRLSIFDLVADNDEFFSALQDLAEKVWAAKCEDSSEIRTSSTWLSIWRWQRLSSHATSVTHFA